MKIMVHGPKAITDPTVIDWALTGYIRGFIQETCQDQIRTVACHDIDEIIVRDGVGVPELAMHWAKNKNIPVKVYKPRAFFDKGAVTMRYNQMMKHIGGAGNGQVVLIWDGVDQMCKDIKEKAEFWFVPVKEFIYKGGNV